jgi:phosphatidylglycerophosphate synthase
MVSALMVQQVLVGALVARHHRHRLNLVDCMTLTRGLAASLLCGLMGSGVRDRSGVAGWMGWLGLLYGAILCDWLDGPIARRYGTSETGAILDREADSWLTLCAAGGAVKWGDLPLHVTAAPLLRYALLFHGLRSRPHADLHGNEPAWVRQVGIVQMLLFIAAMAPFRGSVTSRLLNLVAPVQTLTQLAAALELHRRRLRA